MFTEQYLIILLLNFCSIITVFLCFRWCRDYVSYSVLISASMILSCLECEISYRHPVHVEFFVSIMRGVFVGIPISLCFEAMPFIGRYIDLIRGMQNSEINFGVSNQRFTVLEGMYDLLLPVIFFKSDSHLLMLNFFIRLQKVSSENIIFQLLRISSESMKFAIKFCIPMLLVVLVIEIATNILNRTLSKSNLDFNSIKPLVCFYLLYLTFDYCPEYYLTWLQKNLFQLASAN